jgi:hypothetical protein
MTAEIRLKAPGPKKLLALDGGGIRGAMTIEVLEAIEALLRKELGKPDLVLADYFDFVAGTSTGAILAASISHGMSCKNLRTFYEESVPADVRQGFAARPLSLPLRRRAARGETKRGLRLRHDTRIAHAADSADDGAAQRDHRFAVAALEQSGRDVQRREQSRQQPEDPPVAASRLLKKAA